MEKGVVLGWRKRGSEVLGSKEDGLPSLRER